MPDHTTALLPPRKFGYWTGHFVVVSSMIGAGILTTSGYTLQATGNPTALIVLWVVGGLMALPGAFTIAELSTALPRAGGDYVFVREGFGRGAGFVAGWATFVLGFCGLTAVAAHTAVSHQPALFAGHMQNSGQVQLFQHQTPGIADAERVLFRYQAVTRRGYWHTEYGFRGVPPPLGNQVVVVRLYSSCVESRGGTGQESTLIRFRAIRLSAPHSLNRVTVPPAAHRTRQTSRLHPRHLCSEHATRHRICVVAGVPSRWTSTRWTNTGHAFGSPP